MPDTSENSASMADEIQMDSVAAGSLGLVRVNWTPGNSEAALVALIAMHGSDCAESIAEAIKLIQGSAELKILDASEAASKSLNKPLPPGQKLTICAPISSSLISALNGTAQSRVICLVEDPVVLSANLEHLFPGSQIQRLIIDSAKATVKALEQVQRLSCPVMYLSAARARTLPQVVAAEIATFLNVVPRPIILKTAAQFIDDRGPRNSKLSTRSLEVKGYLNRKQEPGVIRGWAKRTLSEERIYIEVRKGGRSVAEGIADRSRDDLVANKIGDGYHGFDIPITEALSPDMERFEIAAPHFDTVIGYIDMSISKAILIE